MRGSLSPDHYRTLGLPPDASPVEVKAKYRLLSKQYHPDKGGDQATMARLNQAYGILSDTFKRAIYDAERRRAEQAAAQPTTQPQPMRTNRRPPAHSAMPRQQSRTRRANWWPKLAWGFAGLVIVLGILFNLPIAEALTSEPETQATTKPLDIAYPSESSLSNPVAKSPDSTTRENTPPVSTDPQPTADTDKIADSHCTIKAFGPYQRTVCRTEDGTKVCSINTLGTQRFGDCDN